MRAALVQTTEELVVIQDIRTTVPVRLLVALPAVHLKNTGHITLRWIVPSFLQGLAIELDVLLYSFLSRHEKRRGQMKPLRTGPGTAFWGKNARGIDWRIWLLQWLRKKGVVVQLPELPVIGERPRRSPCLHNDVSPLVIALVILLFIDPKDLMGVFEKPPPDAVLQPSVAEDVKHGVLFR